MISAQWANLSAVLYIQPYFRVTCNASQLPIAGTHSIIHNHAGMPWQTAAFCEPSAQAHQLVQLAVLLARLE